MTALTERASADRRLLCLDGGHHRLRGKSGLAGDARTQWNLARHMWEAAR